MTGSDIYSNPEMPLSSKKSSIDLWLIYSQYGSIRCIGNSSPKLTSCQLRTIQLFCNSYETVCYEQFPSP